MKTWIEEDNINYEYILRYIRDTIPKQTGALQEMEIYAKENEVPISQPESIRLIEVLLKLMGAKKILEVGTAIGYSAIRMAKACDGEVVTIELSEEMADRAEENIRRCGLDEKIKVIRGDGVQVLENLQGEGIFDVIFVDAAKGQYMEFFPNCMRLLRKGGVLISDNVLYKGMTADDEHVIRRKITIVKRLRRFISAQMQRSELRTVVLPLGDGVTVGVKL